MKKLLDYGVSYGLPIGIENGYLCITSQDEERIQFVDFTPEVEHKLESITKKHSKSSIERYTAFCDVVFDATRDEWKVIHSPAWWINAFTESIRFHYSSDDRKRIISPFDTFSHDWEKYYGAVSEQIRDGYEDTPLDRAPTNDRIAQLWTELTTQEVD